MKKHKRELPGNTALRGRILDCAVRFFMTAALAGNQTTGGYAPFALGCVAAAGAGAGGLCAVLGAAAGAAVFMTFSDALPFLAVCVLILAASTAFRGNRILSRPGVISLVSVCLFLAVALIYVLESFMPREGLTPCLAAAALTGASAWFLWPLLNRAEGRAPGEGVLFLLAALLLAMQEVTFSGFSLGRGLLCLLLLWTAYAGGPAVGTASGLGVGLTADLCMGGGSTLLTAALGLSGLLSGQYHGDRRWRAALLYVGGTAAALLAAEGTLYHPLLAECGAGTALFLLLPERLFTHRRAARPVREEGMGEAVRNRLHRAAEAVRELYENCGQEDDDEENPAIIFDRAAERVCRNCTLCGLCWQEEYGATFQAISDAAPILLDRGRALAGDFPRAFTSRCVKLPDFLSAVNGELTAFLVRGQYRRQLREARRDARRQYAQFSELLASAAEAADRPAARPRAREHVIPAFAARPSGEVEAFDDSWNAEPYRLGSVLRAKEGERVCGDTMASFETEDGLLCLLLADGMGSGAEAQRESSLTCRLLRQFLDAGIHPEAALKTLNAAMSLRGEETGSFTTVDLCTFDEDSGEASFYKYGAAPSYLKRGGVVRRITGASLPVGLRTAPGEPDVTRLRMEPGCFAVMVSDGVADPNADGWLQDLLAGWEGADPQALAVRVLEESIRRQALEDDCGVQVLYWLRAEDTA